MGILQQLCDTTVYSRMTIVSVVMATCFHFAAILCKSWARFTVAMSTSFSIGLWEDGPWNKDHASVDQSLHVIERDIYMYVGLRVLLVMSMVLLHCGLGTVLSYCCIHRLRFYRLRLTAASGAVCFIAGVLTSLALLVYAIEINKLPANLEPRVSWSFGLAVISVFCSFVSFAFIVLDYKVVSSRHYSVHIRGFCPPRAFRDRF